MSEKLFSQKIKYLNEKLNLIEREFTKLFWDGNPKTLSSRNTTVHKSWLGSKGIYQVKGFYFDEYEISTFLIDNNEFAFTKESFMIDSFDEFKSRVDAYVNYKKQPQVLFEYRYIYFYYRKKKKIVYATLNTLNKINDNKYEVELIPPSSKVNIESYKGYLKIKNERYYISVKNDVEILTLYFVLGRGYADNSKVYGIGLGISHQKGLVEATKELLSKRKLTKEEEDELYLSLNESEYLLADEIEYTESIKKEYLKKINTKLNNLTTFINISKKSLTLKNDVNTDPYLKIFFRNLIDSNEISKKIILEQYYFTARRRSALKAFLKSISNREDSTSKMVYPVFKEDSVLFDSEDEVSIKLLNTISSLAKNGFDLMIIFIINKDFMINDNFNKKIKKLIISGVKIKIAFLENIKKSKISSYDLLYCKGEEAVAIYTNIRDRLRIYKVTTIKDRIKTLTDDFKKIEQKSFDFNEFVEKEKVSNDSVLESLVGEWHYYAYGSLILDTDEFRLWHSMVIIYKNGVAYSKYKNRVQYSGIIDTQYNENQSYIRFTNHESQHLSLIMINNENIDKNIFKVTRIRKQFGTMLDMATFGIFSRKELDENLVKKALGDIDKVMLRENIELEKRINKLF